MNPKQRIAFFTPILLAAACSSGTALVAPELPATIRPPATESVYLVTHARGVQVYECRAVAGAPARFEWAFVAPEARLFDERGLRVGTHYAGPTWEGDDGSLVAGEVKGRDPGPDANAIPWLLLTSRSHAGDGMFAQARSIQRVDTVGGKAPSVPCEARLEGRTDRVPYRATYYFYRSSSPA